MLNLNSRDTKLIELLMQGLSMKSDCGKAVRQQMDSGKIPVCAPQKNRSAYNS